MLLFRGTLNFYLENISFAPLVCMRFHAVTLRWRFTIFARKALRARGAADAAGRHKNFESVHRYKANLYPLSRILTGRTNS